LSETHRTSEESRPWPAHLNARFRPRVVFASCAIANEMESSQPGYNMMEMLVVACAIHQSNGYVVISATTSYRQKPTMWIDAQQMELYQAMECIHLRRSTSGNERQSCILRITSNPIWVFIVYERNEAARQACHRCWSTAHNVMFSVMLMTKTELRHELPTLYSELLPAFLCLGPSQPHFPVKHTARIERSDCHDKSSHVSAFRAAVSLLPAIFDE